MRTAFFSAMMVLGLNNAAVADGPLAAAQRLMPFFAQVREKVVPPQTIPQAGETWIHGGAFDINFRDEAPAGGLLIGFEAAYGKFVGHTIITAIEPIYRTSMGDVSGERHGKNPKRDGSVYAKPGYAVGAITSRAGLYVNGFKVHFMRVGDGRLDPFDSYESPWIGGNTGGGEAILGGQGARVYGIIGMTNKKNELTGMGLLFKKGDLSATAKKTGNVPPPSPQLNPALRMVQGLKAGDTKIIPGLAGDSFRDEAPKGTLLVGLRIGLGKAGNKDYVNAIQPIYRTPTGIVEGEPHGDNLKRSAMAQAKVGYAVGGISVKSGTLVESIKVHFVRAAGAQLNLNDSYQSEWFGGAGGNETFLGGDGAPIVGLIGKTRSNELTGIGLVVKAR